MRRQVPVFALACGFQYRRTGGDFPFLMRLCGVFLRLFIATQASSLRLNSLKVACLSNMTEGSAKPKHGFIGRKIRKRGGNQWKSQKHPIKAAHVFIAILKLPPAFTQMGVWTFNCILFVCTTSLALPDRTPRLQTGSKQFSNRDKTGKRRERHGKLP